MPGTALDAGHLVVSKTPWSLVPKRRLSIPACGTCRARVSHLSQSINVFTCMSKFPCLCSSHSHHRFPQLLCGKITLILEVLAQSLLLLTASPSSSSGLFIRISCSLLFFFHSLPSFSLPIPPFLPLHLFPSFFPSLPLSPRFSLSFSLFCHFALSPFFSL